MSRADEAPDTVARLNALAGGKILGATMGDGGFPAVLVRMPNGTEWWIDLQSYARRDEDSSATCDSA